MPVPERQGQQPPPPAGRGSRLVTIGAAARSAGTGSTISLPAGAMDLSHVEDEDEDVGLTEWERDFRRGAGPPSESEDDDDEAVH